MAEQIAYGELDERVRRLANGLVGTLGLNKGDRVLDLGCSPGSWTQYAATVVGPSGRVVGVDLKPVTIDLPPLSASSRALARLTCPPAVTPCSFPGTEVSTQPTTP